MAGAELAVRNPILGTFSAGWATARSGAMSILRVSVMMHPMTLYRMVVLSRQPHADLLLAVEASTVGMPVTRHPPYSPGRAVFPHPVLRLYSRPRCKAKPSGKHSPTWNFCNTRTRYLDAVEDVGELLPRVTALLTAPPVEPFKRTVHRPMKEAVE